MNRLKLFNYQTKPNISFIGVKLPLSWIRDSQNLQPNNKNPPNRQIRDFLIYSDQQPTLVALEHAGDNKNRGQPPRYTKLGCGQICVYRLDPQHQQRKPLATTTSDGNKITSQEQQQPATRGSILTIDNLVLRRLPLVNWCCMCHCDEELWIIFYTIVSLLMPCGVKFF